MVIKEVKWGQENEPYGGKPGDKLRSPFMQFSPAVLQGHPLCKGGQIQCMAKEQGTCKAWARRERETASLWENGRSRPAAKEGRGQRRLFCGVKVVPSKNAFTLPMEPHLRGQMKFISNGNEGSSQRGSHNGEASIHPCRHAPHHPFSEVSLSHHTVLVSLLHPFCPCTTSSLPRSPPAPN
jgi:hypothetical protein